MYEKNAFGKTPEKCFSSGAGAPAVCENPGGNPKDSRIYFGADAIDTQKKQEKKLEPEAPKKEDS